MSRKTKADLTLLAITIAWGASFPLMKNILEYVPAYAFISIRFFMAAAVLSVLFYKNLKKINIRVLKFWKMKKYMPVSGRKTGMKESVDVN